MFSVQLIFDFFCFCGKDVHLLELFFAFFPFFKKREKLVDELFGWDGGSGRKHFFFFKQKECEWIDFFSCAAHSVFFLFFFANVQKVSISIGGWWSNFFWGIASSGPILVRAQTFQKGAVLFYYMLLFMGKHILPLKRYYFVSYYIFKGRSCTSFPRKAWKEWNPHRPRGRKARSSSP